MQTTVGALFLFLILERFIGMGATTAALVILACSACAQSKLRIPRGALAALIIPATLIALGLLGAMGHDLRDVIKDMWYFSFPALAVFTGYLLAARCKRVEPVLFAFVAAGAILSCWQIIEFITHRGLLQSGSFNDVRNEIGSGYELSALAPLILILASRTAVKVLPVRTKVLPFAIYSVTLIAVILAFSRTITLSLLVSLIAGLGWLTAKRKRGLIIIGIIVGVLLGLSTVVPEDAGSFLGKLAHSRDEVSFGDFSTTTDAIRYWRAYETLRALQTYADGTVMQKATGLGFGQLVDIGFYVDLGGTVMREIPIFHNGYVYVLLKTGYIGLILLLVYSARFYILGARSFESPIPRKRLLAGLTMAVTSTIAISTFVISGWFNPTEMCSTLVMLGMLAGFLSEGAEKKTSRGAKSSQVAAAA
jgi:hypothetical protein